MVFLRLNQYRPDQPRPLEEVRETVRAELVANAVSERSLKAGAEALDRLKGGETLEQLAEDWASNIENHGFGFWRVWHRRHNP